jgi:hypothetical protein
MLVANYATMGPYHQLLLKHAPKLACTVTSDKREKITHPSIQHKHYSHDNVPSYKSDALASSLLLRIRRTKIGANSIPRRKMPMPS